ncbi:GNAT family N-acetyltransferase [Chromohalobacter canadensis]|uniref:GNAT family N-acetyltransferase n=1 Tax=Chromohalobacter canadensis TaxID=141389 RepID=UPI0024105FED|nr:GNAT family N-acetyltransferase [Chromohalobacter canadensis]
MPFIDIRPALETDLADIQSCARRAYAKYIGRMEREPAPMQADFSSQIAEGCVDVATCESQFVGYVVFYPEGDHLHLENIAVLPEYSGRGVGKRLIEYVEHAAKEAGYEAVELYTNEAMTENLAMYPKIGYIEVGRRRESGFNRVFFRKQV